MKHIVSFSGGKDSTSMLLRMVEENMHIDEIIFCDTGLEFPEIYAHIKKVEEYINIPITTISAPYTFEYYMFHRVKIRGKNKGEKGYGWPDFRVRWCTARLKNDVIKRYLKQYKDEEIVEYHGIALDEAHRAKNNKDGRNIKYPLIEWQMTEQDCLNYCYDKGFDWGGLYNYFSRTNCYLCPLQRLSELKVIYTHYPELWAHMRELDKRSIEQFGRKFRSDYSIEELERKFDRENQQQKLF